MMMTMMTMTMKMMMMTIKKEKIMIDIKTTKKKIKNSKWKEEFLMRMIMKENTKNKTKRKLEIST